jgi:hypothetical protein
VLLLLRLVHDHAPIQVPAGVGRQSKSNRNKSTLKETTAWAKARFNRANRYRASRSLSGSNTVEQLSKMGGSGSSSGSCSWILRLRTAICDRRLIHSPGVQPNGTSEY